MRWCSSTTTRSSANLVRRELPMVAVPELPEDPALMPARIADAGYFEALAVTEEDRERDRPVSGQRARARR